MRLARRGRFSRDDKLHMLGQVSSPKMSTKDHVFTLGIEEEFAIVDPETRELRSHIHEILEAAKLRSRNRSSPRCINRWSS